LPFAYHVEKDLEGVCKILESLHVDPGAVRFTVPDVIDTIDGIPHRNKMIDKVHIASTVFSQAMYHQQDSPWIAFRKPAFVVYVGIANALEKSVKMFHYLSFSCNVGVYPPFGGFEYWDLRDARHITHNLRSYISIPFERAICLT